MPSGPNARSPPLWPLDSQAMTRDSEAGSQRGGSPDALKRRMAFLFFLAELGPLLKT